MWFFIWVIAVVLLLFATFVAYFWISQHNQLVSWPVHKQIATVTQSMVKTKDELETSHYQWSDTHATSRTKIRTKYRPVVTAEYIGPMDHKRYSAIPLLSTTSDALDAQHQVNMYPMNSQFDLRINHKHNEEYSWDVDEKTYQSQQPTQILFGLTLASALLGIAIVC